MIAAIGLLLIIALSIWLIISGLSDLLRTSRSIKTRQKEIAQLEAEIRELGAYIRTQQSRFNHMSIHIENSFNRSEGHGRTEEENPVVDLAKYRETKRF